MRTDPLPFSQITSADAPREPVPKEQAAAPIADSDVTPTEEVAEMVKDERRAAGSEQDRDLLDSSKPVE